MQGTVPKIPEHICIANYSVMISGETPVKVVFAAKNHKRKLFAAKTRFIGVSPFRQQRA